jgi:hypothetical protein
MRLLADAIAELESLGYLPPDERTPNLSPAPVWLVSLQEPSGFDKLEVALGTVVPRALRGFWSRPDLVRVLDSWRGSDFLFEPPEVVTWSGIRYLVFMSNPHSGEVGAVRLGAGDDPPVFIGWTHEPESAMWIAGRFTEYLADYIRAGPDGVE